MSKILFYGIYRIFTLFWNSGKSDPCKGVFPENPGIFPSPFAE